MTPDRTYNNGGPFLAHKGALGMTLSLRTVVIGAHSLRVSDVTRKKLEKTNYA